MPIISAIGRRSWKVRLLFVGMYLFLMGGAVTMVYPFLLMISGSTKGAVDIKYFDAVPKFLYNELWLFRKHAEGLFNERATNMNASWDDDVISFEYVELPTTFRPALAAEMIAFLDKTSLPHYAYAPGYLGSPYAKTIPSSLRSFKKWLQNRYSKDLEEVNLILGTEFVGWNSFYVAEPHYLMRREKPADSKFIRALAEYTETIPYGMRYYFSPEGFFKKMFIKVQYSIKIEEYNAQHGTNYESYGEVQLHRRYPADAPPKVREDWEYFLRNTIGLQWIRADAVALEPYHEFLQAKHQTIDTLNRHYGTKYRSFAEVPLVEEPPLGGMILSDWETFVVGWSAPDTGREYQMPVEALRMHSTEFLFRDYLLEKYGSLEALNAALGTSFRNVLEIPLPQADMHYAFFRENTGPLRREFVTRNYKTTAEYILVHGRGIINTVVYCSLAILTALLINPLAAYAMSRYQMPSSYKILLFLMCTMAFPPMVTAIPNFLLLRRLGLLNTFAALILPAMANGYLIFLLKGFFDSLPRELYESASLDGANEWVMFWHITMSLSKPILAVIALQAFTAAYSNFMFAFVVCQEEKMWTLMVWLYQLQQRSGQAVMYASLIIAAIPTLLIFLFCQNIIMRGIVVPAEK